MADIIIPGTNKILVDGTILVLAGFDDVKYIIHNGFYQYNSETFEGWYGVSIPEQNIIPISASMLIGCEIFYYPDSNCDCRYPSGNIPFTTEDEFQVQRAFITVDTMIERDTLSPNMSITNLANGKIVRVNKPNNVDFDPKYYVYRYDIENNICYWEELDIYILPSGGIPEEDLAPELREKIDSANLPLYTVKWLSPPSEGQPYPAEDVARNTQIINTVRGLTPGTYILYGVIHDYAVPAFYILRRTGPAVQFLLKDGEDDPGMLFEISITNGTYKQSEAFAINVGTFDEWGENAAGQRTIAEWIATQKGTPGGIAELDSSGDVPLDQLPTFDGVYEITPLVASETTMRTQQHYLDRNIVVKAIPYAEVTNEANGLTATIGG